MIRTLSCDPLFSHPLATLSYPDPTKQAFHNNGKIFSLYKYIFGFTQLTAGQRKTHLCPFCGSCIQGSPRHTVITRAPTDYVDDQSKLTDRVRGILLLFFVDPGWSS